MLVLALGLLSVAVAQAVPLLRRTRWPRRSRPSLLHLAGGARRSDLLDVDAGQAARYLLFRQGVVDVGAPRAWIFLTVAVLFIPEVEASKLARCCPAGDQTRALHDELGSQSLLGCLKLARLL